jgi:hypothetical protein
MEAGRVGRRGNTKTFLRRRKQRSARRLPLVGDKDLRTGQEMMLTKPSFSWKRMKAVHASLTGLEKGSTVKGRVKGAFKCSGKLYREGSLNGS